MTCSVLATCLGLFAADPNWTDKELLGAIGSTVVVLIGAFVGIGGLIHRSLTGALRSRVRKAEAEADRAKTMTAGLGPLDVVRHKLDEYEAVKAKWQTAEQQAGSLAEQLKYVRDEADGYRQVIFGLTGERDALNLRCSQLERERESIQGELTNEKNRIKKALRRDGAIWTEKVLATRLIEFRPLDPDGRRVPVISMLNLKGGVGKTTTTANLAAALAHRGYRVLLIDLDLQGSLSGMFLTEKEQEQAFNDERLVGNFLEASFDAEFPNLMDYTRQLPGFPTKSMLVPTTDVQAYDEMNLTVRWFLRDARRDPRFLLRKELQMKKVTNHFDIVLLDCPPLLNVSCSNALAASDYVLVPVMPSAQATARVPVLLERVKNFREAINPELRVLGVFANRTQCSAGAMPGCLGRSRSLLPNHHPTGHGHP